MMTMRPRPHEAGLLRSEGGEPFSRPLTSRRADLKRRADSRSLTGRPPPQLGHPVSCAPIERHRERTVRGVVAVDNVAKAHVKCNISGAPLAAARAAVTPQRRQRR